MPIPVIETNVRRHHSGPPRACGDCSEAAVAEVPAIGPVEGGDGGGARGVGEESPIVSVGVDKVGKVKQEVESGTRHIQMRWVTLEEPLAWRR